MQRDWIKVGDRVINPRFVIQADLKTMLTVQADGPANSFGELPTEEKPGVTLTVFGLGQAGLRTLEYLDGTEEAEAIREHFAYYFEPPVSAGDLDNMTDQQLSRVARGEQLGED